MAKPCWSFTEDRQWSRSRILKNWDESKALSWYLEVRSEEADAGSVRMGEMVIRGAMDGTLVLSIAESEHFAF